jgi:putative heme iron utilization protein
MADVITPAVSDRICKHMNDDHADAIVLYAKVYGQVEATAAHLVALDPEGMDLSAQVAGETMTLRIPFDHVLQDSEDAHQTMIAMVRQARQTE